MRRNVVCGCRMGQAVVLLAAMAVAGAAGAQTTVHALGGAVIGYDSNLTAASEHPLPGRPTRQRDGLVQLQTGLALLSESPRMYQGLELTHASTFYFEHEGARAGSERAVWTGLFLLSRRSELQLGAEVARGRLNLSNLLRPAGSTALTTRSSGTTQYASAAVTSQYLYNLSPRWDFRNATAAGFFTPLGVEGPTSERIDVNNVAGFDRIFVRDTLGFGVRTGYFVATPTDVVPAQQQVILGAVARWRRDLTERWMSTLEAGFATAAKVDAMDDPTASPTGRAAISYTTPDGRVEAYVYRAVEPNLIVNQNFISDAVGLAGSMPILREAGLIGSASVGYLHNRRIPITPSAVRSDADVWMADVSLGWMPVSGLTVEARYQRINQTSDNEVSGAPTFSRDVAMLTVRGMFPHRQVSGPLATYAETTDRREGRSLRPRQSDGSTMVGPQGGSTGPSDRRR